MPSEPSSLTDQLCKTPQCGKQVRARGFCVSCYYRNLRQGSLERGGSTKRWKHRLNDIDTINKTAKCSHCGLVKITKRDKKRWRCSVDANARSKDYKRAYRQSKKEQLLDHCEVCGTTEKLCWDHNHKTGLFRGTLCDNCNKAIGHFYDNPEFCLKAAEYLQRKSNE
jgi:hypothetical protein